MGAVQVQAPCEPWVLTICLHYSSAFGAILQASLFGLAGVLPANYTSPIMSGQGLAGFFTSVAMICAIASESDHPHWPACWLWRGRVG